MAHPITVPRLGWSMERGTLIAWLKQPGDLVRPGEPLFELESEKATQPIEAVDGGVLAMHPDAPSPGSIVDVGAVIGYLLAEGEAAPTGPSIGGPKPPQAPAQSELPQSATPAAAPSVRRLARQLGIRPEALAGLSSGGRLTAEAVRRSVATPPVPAERLPGTAQAAVATPRARRLARTLGVDWREVPGTGRNGRVRAADIERAAADSRSGTAIEGATVQPVTSRRRLIAERMLSSSRETAPVTLTARADATNIVSLRNQFKAAGDAIVPGITDILAKLTAAALKRHPMLAACWQGESLIIPARMSIGIAVDTDAGLMVPVIPDADRLSILEFAAKSRDLAARARAGRLTIAESQGGVFTITNLGGFGVDAFTPIINPPQTAVLGIGAIRREPVVLDDDRIVARDRISLSLTFDHRVVDGAPAARFLQTVIAAVENPAAWLLSEA